MTTAVKKIIEELKTLTAAERAELERALRQNALSTKSAAGESAFLKDLENEGVVAKRPRPLKPFSKFKPVPIKGKPLSETILEERR